MENETVYAVSVNYNGVRALFSTLEKANAYAREFDPMFGDEDYLSVFYVEAMTVR